MKLRKLGNHVNHDISLVHPIHYHLYLNDENCKKIGKRIETHVIRMLKPSNLRLVIDDIR